MAAVVLGLLALILLLGAWLSYDRGLHSLDAWRDQWDKWQLSLGAPQDSADKVEQAKSRDLDSGRESRANEPPTQAEDSSNAGPEPEIGPPATADNSTEPLNLQIIFEFDSAELSASAKANLDEVASEFIAAGPGRIRVMGYADNRGDQNYNIDLSQRRANAVAQYLIGSGVDSTFLEVQGLGIFDAADARQTETDPPDISGRVVQLHVQFGSTAWR